MQYRFVLWLIGRLLTVYGLIMLFPLLLAVLLKEESLVVFAISSMATIIPGSLLALNRPPEMKMGIREGFAVVGAAWLSTSLFGALPFWLSKATPTFLDAVFETVSGLTTTGASVISNVEILPQSILLWRSLTHWLGGMGIIVLFIVFLPNIGAGAAHLFNAEVPGPVSERLLPRIRDTALTLWKIYVSFTLAEIVLLILAGMSPLDAVNHSFATLATGGFSNKNASIMHYDSVAIELIIVLFMILAGGNFALYYQVWRKGALKLFRNREFLVYLSIIGGATLLIGVNLNLVQEQNILHALRDALFQVSSIMTTTGFASADFDKWPSFSKLILFLLMFIGGSAGSTAGGIKVSRVIILFQSGWAELKKAIHPKLVINIQYDQKTVEPSVLHSVLIFFFLFTLIFAVSTLILAATGLEPFEAMGAVAATLGNVGPGFGIVGPTTTYASISELGKVVLTLNMLLGRLELFTLLVLIRPEFWRSSRNW